MTNQINILGSYWYFRRQNLTEILAQHPGIDFLADSGAFSAYNSGAEVKLADYAAWLLDHATVINAAATLDVIGDPTTTARNTDELTHRTNGRITIVPVFHVGSPWTELERLCRNHRYVMLGGAVAVAGRGRETAMLRWCVHAHRIARDHGTVLHGLGLTRPPYPEKLPWYSIDSSYWTSATRTGTISLFDGAKLVTFRCGTPRARAHAKLITAYGGNPIRVASPGFGIIREVGEHGRDDRDWMRRAGILAFRRYETWLRARRDPIPAPTPVRGNGIKLYLAANSVDELKLIYHTIRDHQTTTEKATQKDTTNA